MGKKVGLKDGTEVQIRLMEERDIESTLAFFLGLPEEERRYFRGDVTQRKFIEQRVRQTATGRARRLVAIAEGKVVAMGVLEPSDWGWDEHVAEIRLFVAPGHRRKGLGMQMARELYQAAASLQVEQILVKLMRPQKGARKIFRRLGFQREITLPDRVKDQTGQQQDLIVMRCDLASMWNELEDFFARGDRLKS